jgi:hypothetical protein
MRPVDVSTLEITKGTPKQVAVNYKDANGAAIDLTGYVVSLAFRWDTFRYKMLPPVQASGFTLTRSDFVADGQIRFNLVALDTDALPVSGLQQGGPPVGYQIFVGTTLILQGAVIVNRNMVEENT